MSIKGQEKKKVHSNVILKGPSSQLPHGPGYYCSYSLQDYSSFLVSSVLGTVRVKTTLVSIKAPPLTLRNIPVWMMYGHSSHLFSPNCSPSPHHRQNDTCYTTIMLDSFPAKPFFCFHCAGVQGPPCQAHSCAFPSFPPECFSSSGMLETSALGSHTCCSCYHECSSPSTPFPCNSQSACGAQL